MSGPSNIEWTDATWNPVTGCTRVSSGCDHCYAAAMSHRLEAISLGVPKGAGDRESKLWHRYGGITGVNSRGERHFLGEVRCHEDLLEWPLRKTKPLRIFVNSMSDLFHPMVPFEFIDKVFAVMALCPQHTFQVLTKRPERMAEYLLDSRDGLGFKTDERVAAAVDEIWPWKGSHKNFIETKATGLRRWSPVWPLPNVWLGTSVEDQATADERIPHLLQCPAAVRFLSVEPMLGPVDVSYALSNGDTVGVRRADVPTVDWVIVGGESGPGARPMHPDWVRSVRDQCIAAQVPFFFKQWGEWHSGADLRDGSWNRLKQVRVCRRGHVVDLDAVNMGKHASCPNGLLNMYRVGKKAAGAMLDRKEWREWPK